MNLKSNILPILLAMFFTADAQKTDTTFKDFAERHAALFTKAYQSRDLKTYHLLLDDWSKRFNNLPKEEKGKFSHYNINALYNLSCTYALLGNKSKALDYLEKSIQNGYTNYQHIQSDTDLDNLRAEPRYGPIINPLRETGDYLYILKKAGAYNRNDNRPVPTFTYQSPSAP